MVHADFAKPYRFSGFSTRIRLRVSPRPVRVSAPLMRALEAEAATDRQSVGNGGL
jgi:hypothetical protein